MKTRPKVKFQRKLFYYDNMNEVIGVNFNN